MADAALSLENISCTFVSRDDRSQRYTAVSDTSLAIAPGEFVSVVGPTGCGKSTLLNVSAGLLAPSSGSVKVFGQPLSGINERAGYMFQGEALLPWRSASAPAMAVSPLGQVSVSSGSQIAVWGIRCGLETPTFRSRALSASTATGVTSEPVPDVVGIAITGMTDPGTLYSP